MCFSFCSLAAGGKWGSESVGQRSCLQFTAVTRWSTSWKLPFQAPGAGQTSTKSMEKQSFRPHQGLSQIPSFNDEDLYLYSLLHHNMVSQNVCYHSFWKHMYSTYSLVTVDTFFLILLHESTLLLMNQAVFRTSLLLNILEEESKVKSQLFFNELSPSLSFEQFSYQRPF